jgi:peptidoglycan/LPS O-acetylase OafA/YrhL
MTDVMVAQPSESAAATSRTTLGFRPDVEGMRAVAVGLVLLYHAGLRFLPGGFIGVDVFFVISGFLITSMLVREVERSGTVSLRRFYARRAKRLLPAAAVVLVCTAVLTWALVSILDRRVFGGDIVTAALYLVNWRLADRSVDYLAEDVGLSPVQHFWSLAVEEQFYLIWPLLLLLVAWWVRRSGWSVRPSLAAGLALVAVPSFAWSLMMTTSSPAAAFFVTTTRLWELSVGAVVAIALPWLARTPRLAGLLLAWGGLAAVAVAAFVISTETAWPGYAAELPVLGTAAVIAGGVAAGRQGPVVLLGTPLFVWVGGLSYSLYLWHWPMLVLATTHWGNLGTRAGLAVVAASVIPAWLAYRFVEGPIRHAPSMAKAPGFALSVGAGLSLIGVVAGLSLMVSTPSSAPADAAQRARGAAVLAADPRDDPNGRPVDSVAWMTPAPIDAPDDVPDAYERGCQVGADSSKPVTCDYGDPDGTITIAVVGDSKALQWISAIDAIGQTNGWRVMTYTKSSCPFTAAVTIQDDKVNEPCVKWNAAVLAELRAHRPDYVLTSQGGSEALDDPENAEGGQSHRAMIDGLKRRWTELTDAGITVVALADTPQPGTDVYECVAENLDHMTTCAFDKADALKASAQGEQREAVKQIDHVALIDLNDAICPTKNCAPVIGNALVYRQGSHLTKTYVDSLTPRLESALEEIVE